MSNTQHGTEYKPNGQEGFTLFFAIIVVGIVAIVAAFVATSAYRDLDLAATGTASQYAFYAADSGVECALYIEERVQEYNDNNKGGRPPPGQCGEMKFGPSGDVNPPPHSDTNEYEFTFGLTGTDACADVIVKRGVVTSSGTSTVIRARGYDSCTIGGRNPGRGDFERGIQVRITEGEVEEEDGGGAAF